MHKESAVVLNGGGTATGPALPHLKTGHFRWSRSELALCTNSTVLAGKRESMFMLWMF